jgi:hypothetical protein
VIGRNTQFGGLPAYGRLRILLVVEVVDWEWIEPKGSSKGIIVGVKVNSFEINCDTFIILYPHDHKKYNNFNPSLITS